MYQHAERTDSAIIRYTDYAKLSEDFGNKLIHPADLKQSVQAVLNSLLAPIRKRFEDPKLVELTNLAYPEEKPAEKAKKAKKEKGGGGAAAAGTLTSIALKDS